MAYTIGVDLGGTNTVVGLVDEYGRIQATKTVKTESEDNRPTAYINALAAAIKQLAQGEDVKGVGIGAPAANYATGMIEQAANIPWLAWTPLAKILSQELGLPVYLDNDAKAATMGEMAYGAARGLKNFIMLTLGTGIGSGIVIDGHLIYGEGGFAGELGHTTLVPGGRECSCGRRGCLETYCSASGVARTAREYMFTPGSRYSLPRDSITSYHVYRAALEGDKLARYIFEYTGEKLGEALANFVHFSSPQAIILFGGLSKAGDMLLIPTKKSMEANLLPGFKGKVNLVISTLPEGEAALLGAASMVH